MTRRMRAPRRGARALPALRFGLAAWGCGAAPAEAPAPATVPGAPVQRAAAPAPPPPAPDPHLAPVLLDAHGRAIRLADFKGRVRIFDIWASWCGPCRLGIPHLNAVYERYRDRGLVVVGISVDDRPADVVEFEKDVPIRYPHGMSNPQIVELFGEPGAIPTTFVVDRDGRVRRMWQGMVEAAALEREILGLL